MEKSMKHAFKFMFEDSSWKYKLGILSALAFPNLYLSYQMEQMKQTVSNNPSNASSLFFFMILMLILVIISSLVLGGYASKCTQNVIFAKNDTNSNSLLPNLEDNFWGFAKIGVLFSLGSFLVGIVMLLTSILIIPIFFYMFIFIALNTMFCVNFKMKAFFAWKKAVELVKLNPARYWAVIGYSILAYIPLVIVSGLSTKSLLFVFVASIVQAYTLMVFSYLHGTLLDEHSIEAFMDI